jgi:hypothetical protein
VTKSARKRCAGQGHAGGRGGGGKVPAYYIRNLEGKKPLIRLRHRKHNSIKMYLKEIAYVCMNWVQLTWHSAQRLVPMNPVAKRWDPCKAQDVWSWVTIGLWRRTEDGGSTFLRMFIYICLQVYTALLPSRPMWTASPPSEPQISRNVHSPTSFPGTAKQRLHVTVLQ